MSAAPARLLLSVDPRILGDTLELVLTKAELCEVVRAVPGQPAPGHFEVAVVSGAADVDADVVIELLESGGFVAVHEERGERIIELRDAGSLLDLVRRHTAVPPDRAIGAPDEARPPAG